MISRISGSLTEACATDGNARGRAIPCAGQDQPNVVYRRADTDVGWPEPAFPRVLGLFDSASVRKSP